jgi:hypothetical protein
VQKIPGDATRLGITAVLDGVIFHDYCRYGALGCTDCLTLLVGKIKSCTIFVRSSTLAFREALYGICPEDISWQKFELCRSGLVALAAGLRWHLKTGRLRLVRL